ncbi:MAG: hypothetical protein WDN28_04755 [Chthoniobacter sp.]
MKTLFFALFLISATCSLHAQSQVDITIHDGNRLKPGATQKEQEQWIESQLIQSALAATLTPPRQNGGGMSPQQVQALKLLTIRALVLDEIIKKHPDLKAEADALHVQFDTAVTQALMNPQNMHK